MTSKRILHYLASHKHYVISFAIQIAIAGFLIHPWDGFVFITSTTQFLHGTTPYEIAAQSQPYTFYGFAGYQNWFSYPPLSLLFMSASYAPYLFFMGNDPILGRIFLKLTFILGNLLCAYLIYRLVAGVSSQKNASRAEKMVLYNPFLIFIATAWGMFDIWMVNFLLLSVLSLRRDKLSTAGIFFGLSVLLKPIPIIFAPVLLSYIWNRTRSIKKPIVFASAAAIIFVLISLPFLISCPQGFIGEVAGIHLSRPTFGWSAVGLLYAGQGISDATSANIPSLSDSAVSAVSTALLVISNLFVLLYFWLGKERKEKELLASLFLLMLTFTWFSKGLSPQHLVIPMVLAIALLYTYSNYVILKIRDVRWYYRLLVLPYLCAALLSGHHYLTFIPPDVAIRLFGQTSAALDSQIATGFPVSPDFYYFITNVAQYLLIVPAAIMAGIIILRSFKMMIPTIATGLSAYLLRIRHTTRMETIKKPMTIFLIALFMITPALAAVVAQKTSAGESLPTPPPLQDKVVGIFYYFWFNSSFDPDTRYDDWLSVELTPEEGYYSSNIAYMRKDIQQMRDAGVDFAIVPLSDTGNPDIERHYLFTRASEEEGFRFAPMIGLTDDMTPDDITGLVKRALWHRDSSSFLTLGGNPVIWFKDIYHLTPESWNKIKEDVEQQHGELYWIGSCSVGDFTAYIEHGIFDAAFIYSPATVWQADYSPSGNLAFWESLAKELHELSQGCSALTLISTTPYYHDKERGIEIPVQIEGEYSYDLFWKIAMGNEADIILIASWNEYQTSSAVEPTVEFGDLFLQKTAEWCTEFKVCTTANKAMP